MEFNEAKMIVSACSWHSWGNLNSVIDQYLKNGINCTDCELAELRRSILSKLDGLAAQSFEPFYSILLELKDRSGNIRYRPENIYLEFPGRHDILYLRNKMALCEDEQKSRGWVKTGNHIITLFNQVYSGKESVAYQFFSGFYGGQDKTEYLFITEERHDIGFIMDCGLESGDTLTDVIEISEPHILGLIYKHGHRDYERGKGYPLQIHSYDTDNRIKSCWVNSQYLERDLSAKFFCAINELYVSSRQGSNSEGMENNDCSGANVNICESIDSSILIPMDEKRRIDNSYCCVDYSSPHRADRRFSGSMKMKECFSEYQARHIFFSRIATSPSIVIDTDSLTSFAYYWKDKNTDEHMGHPFVLDDHFLSYKLSDDYMRGESIDSKRYKIAVDQINKRLGPLCNKVAKQLSDIPGKPYHLNFAERRYILDMLSGEIIKGIHISKGSTEVPMELSPCGFDMKPYLNRLVKVGFISEVRTNEGVLLRYCKKEHTTYVALTLFAYIMNNKIAEKYMTLDSTNKKWWNDRYNYDGWKQGRSKGKVSQYGWREMDRTKNPKEFRDNYPTNMEGETVLKLSDRGFLQIRGRYFEQLFSMKEGQIRTLKSAALKFDKIPDRDMERQHIIHLIMEVDEELA